MHRSELDYDLPASRIAQVPAKPRDSSRLLVADRSKGSLTHTVFRRLPDFLDPGDLLVFNDTKVARARLFTRKPSGGKVELLFLTVRAVRGEALARPAKRLRPGVVLQAGGAKLTVEARTERGTFLVTASSSLPDLLARRGLVPFPPYIRNPALRERHYQTVFARRLGSAAAPTASLHFTRRLLERLRQQGVGRAFVTLHVGLDTFRPVACEQVEDHPMQSEWAEVSKEAVEAARRARAKGGRVVAVGTTVVRALETAFQSGGEGGVLGPTDLFITPGFHFRAVDALITNFHFPHSTLLALVQAFAGRELIRRAYREALAEGYRFLSLGDAMLIL